MLTEDKVTEIFFMADEFCKFFDRMTKKYTIEAPSKRKYHRDGTLSKAEVMLIMILFHDSGYRCLKHFYLEHVCKHLRHLFPRVVSYNRFVELERTVAIPLTIFIKKVLLGKYTGISFVDSTPLRVCKKPAHSHSQGFQRHRPAREMLHGMVFRLQAPSHLQRDGRIAQLHDYAWGCRRQEAAGVQGIYGFPLRQAGRRQGIHQQGAFPKTLCGRNTAHHQTQEQHEGCADVCIGQGAAQEAGYHRDNQ